MVITYYFSFTEKPTKYWTGTKISSSINFNINDDILDDLINVSTTGPFNLNSCNFYCPNDTLKLCTILVDNVITKITSNSNSLPATVVLNSDTLNNILDAFRVEGSNWSITEISRTYSREEMKP